MVNIHFIFKIKNLEIIMILKILIEKLIILKTINIGI